MLEAGSNGHIADLAEILSTARKLLPYFQTLILWQIENCEVLEFDHR